MSEFNTPAVSYKPGEAPVTPYQKAAEEWDMRIGQSRVQAKNWRLAAFATIAYAAIATAGLVFQSAKSTVTPYVVQVNGDGVVQAIGPARQTGFKPGKPVIEYFIVQFITKVRSIPLDPVVAKNQWLSAYDFLRKNAANTLNEIAVREQPFSKIGQETVAVRVKSVVSLSRDTVQVRWEETSFSKEGVSTGVKGMTGVFNIEITPPTDEKKLRANPLGLFIRQFSWSRDV
jgi:type IV secretion system protein VirB5